MIQSHRSLLEFLLLYIYRVYLQPDFLFLHQAGREIYPIAQVKRIPLLQYSTDCQAAVAGLSIR